MTKTYIWTFSYTVHTVHYSVSGVFDSQRSKVYVNQLLIYFVQYIQYIVLYTKSIYIVGLRSLQNASYRTKHMLINNKQYVHVLMFDFLQYYLLLPMYRATKYPLLLEKIFKYTNPGEADFSDLQKYNSWHRKYLN